MTAPRWFDDETTALMSERARGRRLERRPAVGSSPVTWWAMLEHSTPETIADGDNYTVEWESFRTNALIDDPSLPIAQLGFYTYDTTPTYNTAGNPSLGLAGAAGVWLAQASFGFTTGAGAGVTSYLSVQGSFGLMASPTRQEIRDDLQSSIASGVITGEGSDGDVQMSTKLFECVVANDDGVSRTLEACTLVVTWVPLTSTPYDLVYGSVYL